ETLAVGTTAGADRCDELRIVPSTDAGLEIRRDVRRVHRAEGTVVPATAGIQRLTHLGVTAASASRAEDVLAAEELARLSQGLRPVGHGRDAQHKQGQPCAPPDLRPHGGPIRRHAPENSTAEEAIGDFRLDAAHENCYRRVVIDRLPPWWMLPLVLCLGVAV